MNQRKRPAPLKDSTQAQPSRIAEAINQRLQQYLETKDFHFSSIGDNAIVMRKKVIVEEHSPQLNINRIAPPHLQHPRSSVSHHDHPSHRQNYSMLPKQIRNEIESLKVTIQSQELRESQHQRQLEKRSVHESVQSYSQYSKIKVAAMKQNSLAGSITMKISNRVAEHKEKDVRLPPLIEVKSLAPYEGSALLGIKVPESIRSEIIRGSQPRRHSKKDMDQPTNKIRSSNNLKLKYEQELRDLLDYREKKKRSFNEKFYLLQDIISEQIRKESEERESREYSQPNDRSMEENTTGDLDNLIQENVVVLTLNGGEHQPADEENQKRKCNPVRARRQPPKEYRPPKEINTIYEGKMKNYREFLFQVNLAHGRYDSLVLRDDLNLFKNDWKYRAYVGRGNNSLLIKGLLKRRFWWVLEEEASSSHFVWTQLKMNTYYQLEAPAPNQNNPEEQAQEQRKQVVSVSKKGKKKFSSIVNVPPLQPAAGKFKPLMPAGVDKILTKKDQGIYKKYEAAAQALSEEKLSDFDNRVKLIEKKLQSVGDKQCYRLHNHLEFNYYMGNKKAMFYNMRQYYQLSGREVFDQLPMTFHIKKGLEDREYKLFLKEFKRRAEQIRKNAEQRHDSSDDDETSNTKSGGRNIWIVKPGELSNRGSGITVVDELYEMNNILKKKEQHANGTAKTYIVQAYLDRPLLYHGRKFDLRHYMLITTLYGKMRAYWYSEGYVRTSSAPFDLDDLGNDLIHLTNDAIQKHGQQYGKYQQGNKLSYLELQRYLDSKYPKQGIRFYEHIYPQMRQVALDAVRASYMRLDPRRLQHNFQILGLDFMIDKQFKVWLIEINTNPCLEISSVLLGRIIPTMVEHSFRLTLDVLFPPPAEYPNTLKHLAPDKALDNLKFELIFDEESQAAGLKELYRGCKALECGDISEEDETFDNDGKQVDLDLN